VWSALVAIFAVACGSGLPQIIFTSDRDGNLDIYSVDHKGGEQTNLTPGLDDTDQSSPIVSPDRKLIAFLSGSGDNIAVDVMRINGKSRTQATRGPELHRSHRWSPDSDRIAYILMEGETPVLRVATADGSESVLLTSIPGDEIGDWSADEEWVVFAVHEGESQGIWRRNPDGVNEARLTDAPDYSPRWSPDSKLIAFLSTRDGNPEIYVMKANDREVIKLTGTEAAEYHISWSPNGKRLLFVSEATGNPEIYVTDIDGSHQIQLTQNNTVDEQPVWSPNGKKIAFVSYLDGDAEIFVMDVDGKNQVRLTNNEAEDTNPSW
jgi:Tol biopolymer transport system component